MAKVNLDFNVDVKYKHKKEFRYKYQKFFSMLQKSNRMSVISRIKVILRTS